MSKKGWKLADGKTWRGKLEASHDSHGRMVPIPEKQRARLGKGTMLIPRPLDVEAIMKKVRKGRLMTLSQLRDRLARDAGATCSCALTTGIFVRIVAEAAEEDLRDGRKRITPYWRTIRDDGKLMPNFPGGAEAQAERLEDEGFSILPGRGKQPPRVEGFEKKLIPED